MICFMEILHPVVYRLLGSRRKPSHVTASHRIGMHYSVGHTFGLTIFFHDL